jgi:hypothetical protein
VNLYTVSGDPERTVDTLADGWAYLEMARDLWGLVDERRASELGRVLDLVEARDEVRLRRDEIAALLSLIDGLDAALLGPVIDRDWNVAIDRVPDVLARAPAIAFRTRISEVEQRAAVGEALQRALVAHGLLAKAARDGFDVVAE